MNEGIVIDASVSVAWVHPAQSTPETAALLSRVEEGLSLVVPSLWFVEVANVFLVLTRRKKLTAAECTQALSLLSRLNVTIDELGPRRAFTDVREIAEEHRLTVYDAMYLEVSRRRNLAFASRDEALKAAAKRMGVALA